jgi:hypothetical protein
MELYILNNDYEQIAVIDEAESKLWNKKFNDVGECEIYVPCSDEMLSILQKGYYVYRYDDDMFCQIEKVKIETDVENGDYLIATATDICKILSGRIVRGQTDASLVTSPVVFSGTVANFIKKLITDNVINPPSNQAERKIANFIFDDSNFSEFSETIETSVVAKDLLQLIISTCKSYNYGFRVSYNTNTQKLVFRLYKGKNKASASGEEYVEFSPEYSNIISSEFEVDGSALKNVAYVGYKTAADEFALLSLFNGDTQPSGEARKEIYIDGTGTSRSITVDELQSIFHGNVKRNPTSGGATGYYYVITGGEEIKVATFEGETKDGVYSEKVTVTDYTYLLLIKALGRNALAENVETQYFSGEVDTIDTYEYKTDYDLGDTVKVINEYGIEAEAQITEVMESEDTENGYQIEPKFEYIN